MAKGWLDTPLDLTGKRVWVAGHAGMVGAALLRRLEREPCEVITSSRANLDLRDQLATREWVGAHKPDIVILAAARVGGILDNANNPADFLYDNLMIEANVIHAAHKAAVGKLLFLGSSCIYPKNAANPITEDALLSGALEPTNEAYAIAKIAGLKLCQSYRSQHTLDFISAMPCNLYGPGDTYNEVRSHVIPALMMKAHNAKISGAQSMEVWGSGAPRREFLYVDDFADALVFMLQNYSDDMPLNIGAGVDISIKDLARKIASVVGFDGALVFDETKPDGVFEKLLDTSRIQNKNWSPRMDLETGLSLAYEAFRRGAGQRDAA